MCMTGQQDNMYMNESVINTSMCVPIPKVKGYETFKCRVTVFP